MLVLTIVLYKHTINIEMNAKYTDYNIYKKYKYMYIIFIFICSYLYRMYMYLRFYVI